MGRAAQQRVMDEFLQIHRLLEYFEHIEELLEAQSPKVRRHKVEYPSSREADVNPAGWLGRRSSRPGTSNIGARGGG